MTLQAIFFCRPSLKRYYISLVGVGLVCLNCFAQVGGCGTSSPDEAGWDAVNAIAFAAAMATSTAEASSTPPPSH